MQLLAAALASTAILTCHVVGAAPSEVTAEEQANVQKYVHLSFDKLRGDSYDTASTGSRPVARLRKRADGYEEIEIKNEQNFYSVELDIGTPAQKVTVLIDTGSSDLWVTGPENPYCERSSNQQDDDSFGWLTSTRTIVSGSATRTASSSGIATVDCQEFGVFNSSQSSTFNSNNTAFFISYGDATFASGTWGTDSFNLGDINVTSLSFAVANSSNSTVGVFGIGLPGLQSTYTGLTSSSSGSKPYQYQNFPMKLRDEGIIHHNAYSLFLNEPDAERGSVLFGAVDHSKYSGQLNTVPLLNPYKSRGIENPIEFDITVQGVSVSMGGSTKTVTTTQFPVLLDSGTTLSYMPYTLTELIAARIGARYSSSLGYYTLQCPQESDNTQFVYDFGGFFITANLSDYIIRSSSSSNTCYLGIVPINGNSAIFGDNFLINAYVVYDLENYEISMAQARYNDSESDIEVISGTIPGAVRASQYSSTWSTAQSITSATGTLTSGSTTRSSTSSSSSPTTSRKNSAGDKLAPSSIFFLFASIASFLI